MRAEGGHGEEAAEVLRCALTAAVDAVSLTDGLAQHLPEPPRGRTVVVGAGKAAAVMARAVETAWPHPLSGVVLVPPGHEVACDRIAVRVGGHPVPNEASLAATESVLAAVRDLTADDLVLCLLSGGGSALLCKPAPGLSLADKQAVTRSLLRSGAAIVEINCVRKHLSAVKGGRLAAQAAPATVATLAVSDVPGDDPAVLASGPTTPDPTTRGEALAIIRRYGVEASPAVLSWLEQEAAEAPKPGGGEPHVRVIARPADALAAAADACGKAGYAPWTLFDYCEGEAREVAELHAAAVRRVRAGQAPVSAPCAILSGGETTVTVHGSGRGGRNTEFLLALAIALDGAAGVSALAADTDGLDGSGDNAGALFGPEVLKTAAAQGVSAAERLADNDAYGFFEAVGGLVITGPTRTNVNDLRVILIDRPDTAAQVRP